MGNPQFGHPAGPGALLNQCRLHKTKKHTVNNSSFVNLGCRIRYSFRGGASYAPGAGMNGAPFYTFVLLDLNSCLLNLYIRNHRHAEK